MSSSSAELIFQQAQAQEESSQKTFIFKQILNENRQQPHEIIADFRECLQKANASFLLRESRELGCISVTYYKKGDLHCQHARYAYSSHQWTNVILYLHQQQCGLLHLGQIESGLTFELIKKNLKSKQACYLIGTEKQESRRADLLSAVVVYANDALYYVDLRTPEIIQLIDPATAMLVNDIVLLERGDYVTANEAQLESIAALTNRNKHKKLEFTQVDRETIGNKGKELLNLVCSEKGLSAEQMLLPNDEQATDKLEYSNDGYKMMQQLERQLKRLDLQPPTVSKKQRLSDKEIKLIHYCHNFFLGEENIFHQPAMDLENAVNGARKRKL